MKVSLVILLVLLLGSACKKQELKWSVLDSPTGKHSRGLVMANDAGIWMSGYNGSVAKTTDFGKHWDHFGLSGADSLDLRDIHAFDMDNALALTAGSPALIYRTENGGKDWRVVYKDTNPAIFYDGMDFWNDKDGIAFGDPMDGRFALLSTSDGGKNWREIAGPEALEGEGGFAASGTSICTAGSSTVWLGTGMVKPARILRSIDKGLSWESFATPLRSGEGCGVFSMAFWNELEGVIVGGCYADSADGLQNCAFTEDGGKSWTLVEDKKPRGYRSCVAANEDGSFLIASGRTGTDYSLDQGRNWSPLGDLGYYSVAIGEDVAWATGRSGRVAWLPGLKAWLGK